MCLQCSLVPWETKHRSETGAGEVRGRECGVGGTCKRHGEDNRPCNTMTTCGTTNEEVWQAYECVPSMSVCCNKRSTHVVDLPYQFLEMYAYWMPWYGLHMYVDER